MASFKPEWLPITMGSLPHTDPAAAWRAILAHCRPIPFWPGLPRRGYQENMYAQFSERFPGIRYDKGRIYIDRQRDLNSDLERLYLAYLEDDLSYGRIGKDHAEGLARLREGDVRLSEDVVAIKGQATGPVSFGLTVVDRNQRPILYDEVLADAVGKHLRLKVAWQEGVLSEFAPTTIIMLEEPYMASFGSAFVSLPRDQVVDLLEEVFAGLKGLRGIHCCGNTDWSLAMSTSVDIVSLDAYDYAESLTRYAEDVSRFLKRGGIIAWGIVPASSTAELETVESLVDRLHAALDRLVERGVDRDALLAAGLVSPSCGLGALTPKQAEHALALTAQVSEEMRRRYAAPPRVGAPAGGESVPPAEASGGGSQGEGGSA